MLMPSVLTEGCSQEDAASFFLFVSRPTDMHGKKTKGVLGLFGLLLVPLHLKLNMIDENGIDKR
ncbi:hypothetical protein HMPREF2137_11005 [Hoylesella buccalis DNF00853]|uniref:Uncharacterized protein n=1 Tax=Hoylesella buccalis DNF00853 TaxID=1401074 RepID=A0A095ZGR5_9BACT|nr:hypothetical protein HMPREF2137_11005 [Hoylesella buccalis DNF00853]